MLLAGATAVTHAATPAAAANEQSTPSRRVDERHEAAADGPIRVDIAHGRLRIVGTEAGPADGRGETSVRVRGSVDAALRGVTVRREAGAIEVRTRLALADRVVRVVRSTEPPHPVDLEIEVPAASRLFVVTRDAEITIEDVRGPIGVGAVSSRIVVDGDPAWLSVETLSGSLDFAGRSASVTASTLGGDLSLQGTIARARLDTVSGAVRLLASGLEELALTTVSGAVSFGGRLAGGAEASIGTDSGRIELAVGVLGAESGGSGAALELRTGGEIVDRRSGAPTELATGEDGSRLTLGESEATIRVRSRTGQIVLVEELPAPSPPGAS
ncbi:MAG: hypothetical protein DWQ36_22340 [Acidobacteria bacterium]|nr:MAG: hypothetical protein DWQ30_06660 [Acidobacteriota bacterium]REK00578.1 MAG: hypothetical protein DWQ36_22340 [Acidobacteriota bacterium]